MFRYNNRITPVVAVLMLSLSTSAMAEAGKNGRPGDEFRKAAVGYDKQASEAVQQATRTQGKAIGKHLELSAVYREMASIKRSAASMADQGRWDDINWDRYQKLEGKRDRLMGQVGKGFGKGKSNHKSDQKKYDKGKHGKNKATGKKKKSGEHGFMKAAEQYEKEAGYARDHAGKSSGEKKAMYQELASTFQDMADIKREAATAAQDGRDYDWSLYKRLSQRRDRLQKSIKHAKK